MLLFSNAMQINMSRAISCSFIEVNLSLLNSVQFEISNGFTTSYFQSNFDNSLNMAVLDMSTNSTWSEPVSEVSVSVNTLKFNIFQDINNSVLEKIANGLCILRDADRSLRSDFCKVDLRNKIYNFISWGSTLKSENKFNLQLYKISNFQKFLVKFS